MGARVKGFEFEHAAFRIGKRRTGNNRHQVLDTNAVFACFVISGLIGNDHARLQGYAAWRL